MLHSLTIRDDTNVRANRGIEQICQQDRRSRYIKVCLNGCIDPKSHIHYPIQQEYTPSPPDERNILLERTPRPPVAGGRPGVSAGRYSPKKFSHRNSENPRTLGFCLPCGLTRRNYLREPCTISLDTVRQKQQNIGIGFRYSIRTLPLNQLQSKEEGRSYRISSYRGLDTLILLRTRRVRPLQTIVYMRGSILQTIRLAYSNSLSEF